MSWHGLDERCPEWPFCTGHMGPTPEEREYVRRAAAKRVAVKRAVRCTLMRVAGSA